MRGAPANSCAFISALDLLRGAPFLHLLTMEYSHCPILAHVLRRNPYNNCVATFRDAMVKVRDIAKELNRVDLADKEDPWLIIWALRSYL